MINNNIGLWSDDAEVEVTHDSEDDVYDDDDDGLA